MTPKTAMVIGLILLIYGALGLVVGSGFLNDLLVTIPEAKIVFDPLSYFINYMQKTFFSSLGAIPDSVKSGLPFIFPMIFLLIGMYLLYKGDAVLHEGST